MKRLTSVLLHSAQLSTFVLAGMLLTSPAVFAKDSKTVTPTAAPAPAAAPVMVDESRPNLSQPSSDQAQIALRRSEHRIEDILNHWYVGIGNVWATSLVGTANSSSSGTKMNIEFMYANALAEHFNYIFFYDSNLNTDTLGKSDINVFGTGIYWLLSDRLSSATTFLRLDGGYGGGNRYEDGGGVLGAGIGEQFFRNDPFSFEVIVRFQVLFQATTTPPVNSNPTLTQLRFGVNF